MLFTGLGRSVLGKTMPSVSSTALGLRPRTILETSGCFSQYGPPGRGITYIEYRHYFMESARVRDFRTSWWSIWNRTSERSERVRFLILHQRVCKSRTKRFQCCNLFILYILSLLRACKACLTCSNWLSSITLQGYLQAFKCRLKLQISPLKLEGSKSSPSFLLTAIINSLIYSLSSFGGISSILLLSFLELRNSASKLTSLRVFERVFLFFWSSINLSIGLSGDTNLLDCSAILKNIS